MSSQIRASLNIDGTLTVEWFDAPLKRAARTIELPHITCPLHGQLVLNETCEYSVCVLLNSVDSADPLLQHKTKDRRLYEEALQTVKGM